MLTGVVAGLAAGALWGLVFVAPRMVEGFGSVDLTAVMLLGKPGHLRWGALVPGIVLTALGLLLMMSPGLSPSPSGAGPGWGRSSPGTWRAAASPPACAGS